MSETIGIIGIGKLGLCFALNLERNGFRVIGADVDPDYIRAVNEKRFNSPEPQVSDLLKTSKQFFATDSLAPIIEAAEVIFIAVPTPTSPSGYDHVHVDRVTDQLIALGIQKKRKHLVVCCTTMPGYCDKLAERSEERRV